MFLVIGSLEGHASPVSLHASLWAAFTLQGKGDVGCYTQIINLDARERLHDSVSDRTRRGWQAS